MAAASSLAAAVDGAASIVGVSCANQDGTSPVVADKGAGKSPAASSSSRLSVKADEDSASRRRWALPAGRQCADDLVPVNAAASGDGAEGQAAPHYVCRLSNALGVTGGSIPLSQAAALGAPGAFSYHPLCLPGASHVRSTVPPAGDGDLLDGDSVDRAPAAAIAAFGELAMPLSPSAADDTVFDNYIFCSFPARVPLFPRLLPKKSDLQRQLLLCSFMVKLRKRESCLVLPTRVEDLWPSFFLL